LWHTRQVGGVDLTKFNAALDRLRSGVEIWINGSASAPLLFDNHWGGMVSCGCDFDGDTQNCRNSFPNCPALTDAGQNFGHGFYNDHHFHYGYHIYAAAVVAKFDYAWARKHHEQVKSFCFSLFMIDAGIKITVSTALWCCRF